MSEWISVFVEMPEDNDVYLVAWKSDSCDRTFIGICEFTEDEGFILNTLQAYEYFKNDNIVVTHWMPLPDAPTE